MFPELGFNPMLVKSSKTKNNDGLARETQLWLGINLQIPTVFPGSLTLSAV